MSLPPAELPPLWRAFAVPGNPSNSSGWLLWTVGQPEVNRPEPSAKELPLTVIVAARTEDNGVVMAADQQATAGWQKIFPTSPKLWIVGKSIFGAAGVKRATQVLKHHVEWPKYRPDEDTDLEAWLITTVVPAIRTGVSSHGVVKNDAGVESLNCTLMYATGDHLAEVDGDYCVSIEAAGRMAIGSGYAEALGRLGDRGPWTEDDVIDAARRAIQTDRGCGGAISVVNTKTLTIRTVES